MRSSLRESIAKFMAATCVGLLLGMLVFRAFVYSHMYLEPGSPYGVSDLIEFGLGAALLLTLAGGALSAVWLAFAGRRERVVAGWVGLIVVTVALSAGPLHNIVARWASA